MLSLTRRQFGGLVVALGSQTRRLAGAAGVGDALREGLERRKIPALAAMVATADKTIYVGAFGKRDSASSVVAKSDSIFRIASMTKAITTAAAMQLVEQGKLQLDRPVSEHLPELAKLDVLEGFDQAGKPIVQSSRKPIALKHLMTHTSGFVYPNWDPVLTRYNQVMKIANSPGTVAPLTPLRFEPGTRWQYGTGIDWTGKLVEKVSGLTLEEYFQRNILQPLGMKDTSFVLREEKFARLASSYRRQTDGSLKEDPRTMPAPPKVYNGGGGLYSTAEDYIRFTQMILRKGRSAGKDQILSPKSVEMMSANQIGSVNVEKLISTDHNVSEDVDMHPGAMDKYTFGFLMNPTAYPGGRSAGSLAWAGVENTFYWIDPRRGICAVIMMQFFPFVDKQAVGLLADFERAVYANLAS
jgi:CubicO group peptidase (beta-lactamase class C family)